MVDKLKALGREIKYSKIEAVGHNVWDYAYNEELISWLLSKNKNNKF